MVWKLEPSTLHAETTLQKQEFDKEARVLCWTLASNATDICKLTKLAEHKLEQDLTNVL